MSQMNEGEIWQWRRQRAVRLFREPGSTTRGDARALERRLRILGYEGANLRREVEFIKWNPQWWQDEAR